MRADQPKVVYLPSHNSEKVHYHRTNNPSSKLKLRRSKQQPPEVNNCIGDWYLYIYLVAPPVSHPITSRLSSMAGSMSASNAENLSGTSMEIRPEFS